MKRLFVIIWAFLCVLAVTAQDDGQQQKFSPEKFDADLQEFITKEASLTQQEAAKFFPVYKEMQTKQRALFERQKNLGMMKKPEDEKACLKAIRERDEIEMEMKRIQQSYHEKFLEQLPARKVYAIIQAEDNFHRRMLRRWSHRPQNQKSGHSQRQKFGWPNPGQMPAMPQQPQK